MTTLPGDAAENPHGQPSVEIHGDAHDSSTLIQIDQLHVSPQEPRFHADILGALNADEAAKRLARLPLDDAVRALVDAPVGAAAEVLEALLSDNEEAAISLLAHTRRSKAQELVAAIASAPPLLENLPSAAAAIGQCERSNRSHLGESRGAMARSRSERGTEGYWRTYEKGIIYWTLKAGAQPVYGSIGKRHKELGASGGRIGFPLTPEKPAERSPFGSKGVLQRYESNWDYQDKVCEKIGLLFGATIYWSGKSGAHATWGGIGEYYEDNGGTGSPLGFPVTGELEVDPCNRKNDDGATGWRQRFEGGVIYWSEKTNVITMPSSIAECYDHHRGLGFPVTPVMSATTNEKYNTEGSLQRFEAWEDYRDILENWSDPGGATIYTSDKHGTYCVAWGNGALYESLGGTNSWLGFPRSDEIDARVSEDEPWSTIQEFEGGAIFYKQDYGSVPVSSLIMEYFAHRKDMQLQLGFPVREALTLRSEDGDLVQFFERGVVTVRAEAVEAWVRPDQSS